MTAYISVNAKTPTPLFIFGDHASNHIPSHLNNLGLSSDDLTRHIAWDIGTAGLIDGLCAHFGCGGQMAGVSRLVIDVHRDPEAAALIPEVSDGTRITANQNLPATERKARLKIHTGYHNQLEAQLDAVMPLDPLIVSMHSFTPQPKTGEPRETDIGFLYKGDVATTLAACEQVKHLEQGFTIGLNKPYSAFELYYTLDRHVIDRGLRHLMFEIRQDLIDTDAKVKDMTQLLARVLKPLL